ncbi:MAG: hypothetical protein Q9M20_02905, partial [Mariprofundaceae bacterium]|nr:hypothetical protein [Mariprofundaceae bacterium]
MPELLLSGRGLCDAKRAAFDVHNGYVVASVLTVIAIYLYFFTHIALLLHIPMPEELAHTLHIWLPHFFDRDHNIDSNVVIQLTQLYPNNDSERMVYYFLLIGAFLSAYFLPIAHKQTAIVLWAMLTIGVLYGIPTLAGLICAHMTVYLVLHPKRDQQAMFYGGIPGAFLAIALVFSHEPSPLKHVLFMLLPIATSMLYCFVLIPVLKHKKYAAILQTMVIQSAIITVFSGAIINGILAEEFWKLPLGLLFFFWHWERLIMYHIDYKDGCVPNNVKPFQYFAVFFSPGGIPNLIDRVCIGQGYTYVHTKFLCKNKNIIVMSGVKLLCLALLYLVMGDWFITAIKTFFEGLGFPIYGGSTHQLVGHYMDGEAIGTLSVLTVT